MTKSCLVSVAFALLCCTGCVSNTYEVRRSALVPALAPPIRSGRAIDGRVQVSAHAGRVLTEADPETNGTSGMYVARTDIGMAARFRIGKAFDMGPLFQAGLGGGSMAAGPDLPKRPSGNAVGTGISMQVAPRFEDERFGLAGVLDILLFSVPIREEWWCLDCGPVSELSEVRRERELVPIYSLALLPSYQVHRALTLFGGLTIRNQPTIHRSEVVTSTDAGSGGSEDPVDAGPLNATASLGAEANLGAGAHVLVVASQPMSQSPVQYGPSVATALSFSFGEPAPR